MDPLSSTIEGSMVVIGRTEMGVEMGEDMPPSADRGSRGSSSEKEHWSDGSRMLFQPGYFKVLKELALSGQLQLYNMRSVCWRLFLGCLPEEQSEWEESCRISRNHFERVKKEYITDPYMASASLDVAVNNPLSQAETSPWHQFFLDNELRQTIEQDVVRTFPDVMFFKQQEIQDVMMDILFCYAKEHPEVSYRQGMHEILAPIMFVLHAEMRDVDNDPTLAPVLKIIMDPDYIEHDAYTIFSELMELLQLWYMYTSLEADHARVKEQNSRKAMNLDPRKHKPFEDVALPTSAIARKLDVIHHVLLKKADGTLYTHLRDLAIPPQTYGIRWIRLLFGREFPLPSVLELWDALFADGPSLGLVDYMCVAMLIHIREVLIGGDYAMCMHHLMHFPTVYEVSYLVQRALHLRNPASYPAPREWTYHPSRGQTRVPIPTAPTRLYPYTPTPRIKPQTTTPQSKTSKAKQAIANTAKQIPRVITRQAPRERSPVPSQSAIPKPRAKSSIETVQPREMTNNPKANPRPSAASSNQLDRLREEIDELEAKCRYCGSKMESLLSALQSEVTELTNLPPDAENVMYISLAGLKQVRDLLLNKIPFSGDVVEDWETTPTPTPTQKPSPGAVKDWETTPTPLPTQKPSPGAVKMAAESSDSLHQPTTKIPATPQSNIALSQEEGRTVPLLPGAEQIDFHPLLTSGEMPLGPSDRVCEGVRWGGAEEEWVHLSASSPPPKNE